MKNTSFIFLTILISFFGLYSQSQVISGLTNIDKIFADRGEVYFKFQNNPELKFEVLTRIISIDSKTNNNWVYAYANKNEFIEFLKLNVNYEILQSPGTLIKPLMKDVADLKQTNDWDFYPTYEAYVDMMYQFATDYPDLCQVFSIGQTVNGRELLFARISDNPGQDEGEPQFMYTGTMHGDETTGFVLLLRLIDYLLSNYGTDNRITNLVNNIDIWINPAANPDGTYAGGNNTVYGSTRYNGNNVDLNRNYPDPQDGPHPDNEEWQPETLAFMQLAEENHTHGGFEICNYPWDTWSQLHADDDWWQYVCHEYADTVHAFAPLGYMSGFDNGITNGYEWYTMNGGRQDYMNYFQQCREFTLEMSYVKTLPANQLPDHWEYNYRSFLNYMEQVTFGITGIVSDSITGNSIYAQVFIQNHDIDSSMVFSHLPTGKYFRPVYEGVYNVTFKADGYHNKTIENVQTFNRQLTVLNAEF